MRHIPVAQTRGPMRFLRYHRNVHRALRASKRADILFACDLYSLTAASVNKEKDALLLYDAREVYTELPTVAQKPLSKIFWRSRERSGLCSTDIVITTAPLDGDAIAVIHSSLPPNIVVKNVPMATESMQKMQPLREHFKIDATKKIIVYVGGLQQGRGLEVVIRAMKQLDDAVLVLIGDGVLTDRLKDIARREGRSNAVFFYGPVSSKNVLSLLESADVGISLIERKAKSYRLALPSKLFEYLRAGLPVVSSPLVQVKECMGEREYIFYADEENEDDIVNALRRAIICSNDIEARKNIALTAQREFIFEHDIKNLFDTIVLMQPLVRQA